jgi:beta-phosphoglucomutase-like phosphatase (HAD superfamily)
LDQLSVPYCLATSSSPERTEKALRLTGVFERFENRIFTASEVARGKPAPDLFLHAARRMNVAPARCLVIEDSVVGVQAGVAAGMPVLRFIGGAHLAGLDGDVSNNADLPDGNVQQFSSFDALFDLTPDLSSARLATPNGE